MLEIGGIKIHSYGFFIALGYVCTLLMGRWLARSRGLDPGPFMDLAFIAIVSGVVGARLLYVITMPGDFLAHPAQILDFWSGGLVFYGGFLLATVACLAYGFLRKMPILLSTDIVVTGVAFAHGFGRIGCFAAGCCHGNYCPYPWAIHSDSPFVAETLRHQPIHPVQLYESASLFFLSGLLIWIIRGRKLRDGLPAIVYLMGYAAIRFVWEMFRGDIDRGDVFGGLLSTSQFIALGLFTLGFGLFFFLIGRKHT